MEIGIDIEKVSRFSIDKKDIFIKTYFTPKEIDYCFSKSEPEKHLCGIFCAKEALLKITEKLHMKEIEVNHNKMGKPAITVKNLNYRNQKFKLSISHCEDYAVACILKIK